MKLSKRKEQILKAIINEHGNTADTVSSSVIALKYNLSVSSATLRNEMAEMEEQGYLCQPHTSAGRLPTFKAYRYYIDVIMDQEKIPEQEKELIIKELSNVKPEINAMVEKTTHILSQKAKTMAIVLSISKASSIFHHIRLISIAPLRVLVVLVTNTGISVEKIITTDQIISQEELNHLSVILEERFNNLPLSAIDITLLDVVKETITPYWDIIKEIMSLICERYCQEREYKIFYRGTTYLLEQPEFKDIRKVQEIIEILEKEEVLFNLLENLMYIEGLKVSIGMENPCQKIQDCSIISSNYLIDNQVIGCVGILGPTRMSYNRLVPLVETVADSLSMALGRLSSL